MRSPPVLLAAHWDRARSEPLDVTHVRERLGFYPPTRLVAFDKRDALACRAHLMLAEVIQHSNGDPTAAGVQWVRAAARALPMT